MSKLFFSPIDQAFTLGSSQIKDTQEEITKLTELILQANKSGSKKQETSPAKEERIGKPDKQVAVFSPPDKEDIDYNLMKVIGHPKFDDIVKNYVLINHPEWLLREVAYRPQAQSVSAPSVSTFGSGYQNTICTTVRNYVLFFISCVVIFMLLSLQFKGP
jgi:hypothetical protein